MAATWKQKAGIYRVLTKECCWQPFRGCYQASTNNITITRNCGIHCLRKWLLSIWTPASSSSSASSSYTKHCYAKYARKRKRSLCASPTSFMSVRQLQLSAIYTGESPKLCTPLITSERLFKPILRPDRDIPHRWLRTQHKLSFSWYATELRAGEHRLTFFQVTTWTAGYSASKRYPF